MANKGLYYYKLVSPYKEDVTKDCKLTINEIDSNFETLKNENIKDVTVDKDKKEIVVLRNNGEEMILELSDINPELTIDYDSVDGVIDIAYDNEKYSINGLITKDNLSKEILTKVYSDGTLRGTGTSRFPLSVSPIMRAAYYKPVKRLVDMTLGERVPFKNLVKGDRYAVLTETSNYGLLYDFEDVRHLNRILADTGWRVPSKSDWDNMLNAIEPCEFRNHNSTLNNRVLGRIAGTLLKSEEDWVVAPEHIHPDHGHHHHDDFEPRERMFEEEEVEMSFDDETFDIDVQGFKPGADCHKPMPKPIKPIGEDSFGMSILPAGYAYHSRPMQFVNFGCQGAFWTTDMIYDSDVYTKVFTKHDSGVLQIGERPTAFLSVRLVKDYDGTNHNEVENILGQNYKTILMPSLNNPNSYSIWTAQNIAIVDKHIRGVEPNHGLGIERRKVYYIYEWNGFDWDRIELVEGDSFTMIEGERPNEVYRIVNDVLVNADNMVIDVVKKALSDDINKVNERVDEINDIVTEHNEKLHELDEQVAKLESDLVDATEELKSKDEELENKLTETATELKAAIDANTEADKEALEALNAKDAELAKTIASNKELLDAEIDRAVETENELRESITSNEGRITSLEGGLEDLTVEVATKVSELNQSIEDEANRAQEAENKLSESVAELESDLEDETSAREKADEELKGELEAEVAVLTEADEKEAEARETADKIHDEKIEVLEGKTFKKDSCVYDYQTGILTLETEDGENTIEIKFSNNYGTLNLRY